MRLLKAECLNSQGISHRYLLINSGMSMCFNIGGCVKSW